MIVAMPIRFHAHPILAVLALGALAGPPAFTRVPLVPGLDAGITAPPLVTAPWQLVGDDSLKGEPSSDQRSSTLSRSLTVSPSTQIAVMAASAHRIANSSRRHHGKVCLPFTTVERYWCVMRSRSSMIAFAAIAI